MRLSWRWVLLSLLSVVSFGDSLLLPRQLLHDAYIWQRQWNVNVAAAMHQSDEFIRTWRVLAATSDIQGHVHPVAADWAVLASSGRTFIPVIRIEGQLIQWDNNTLSEEIHRILETWHAQQLPIAGIEIDHDCATARLPAYAEFLANLRGHLDHATPLFITALPTWLSSPHLRSVLRQVDEVVLQVHAVQNPHAGLFDPHLARQWVNAWARLSVTPFRVALPTYGSRVSWNVDGSIAAVESEIPLLAGGHGASELMASPTALSSFLRDLERHPLPRVLGIVWFRLPIANDRRAWSLETWWAVMTRRPLGPHVEIRIIDSETPGMHNLLLVNRGEIDVELPQQIALPNSCTLADGINGYALGYGDGGLVLQRVQQGLLRSQRRQLIGWIRCAVQEGDIHVRP